MSIWSAILGMAGQKPLTWTFSETLGTGFNNVQNIFVKRNLKTSDGIFGALTCDYSTFTCETVENLLKEMLPGRYRVVFDVSPRLGYLTPHIMDADRDRAAGGDAGLRMHKANEPSQLDGCIALGQCKDGDAVDYSEKAFNEFMLLTDKTKETWIEITEAYANV